jgi:hypothetical protein
MNSYPYNYNTDNEDDDDEDDDHEGDDDIIYESDEPNINRFTIGLCEIYNEEIHGKTECCVKYNYLTYVRFKYFNYDCIKSFASFINNMYQLYFYNNLQNNIFKNYYKNISSKGNCINPEIIECKYLLSDTGYEYSVCIIKTIWIKLIQRTWKKIYKKRKEILMNRILPTSLFYREKTGKWPENCYYYPGLHGMLSYLHSGCSSCTSS